MNQQQAVQPLPIKISFYYGWVIVAIAALGVFFSSPGQTYSISVFINAYIEQFGWSRSMVSSLYSTATLAAGLILPAVGRWTDKTGHRRAIVTISALLGTACLWMSFVINPVMLFVGFLLTRLLGQGSMTLIPSIIVPQWFVKKRGMALSIMALGGVFGSALSPFLNNWLIENVGISFAWRFWSILLMGAMAPISWIFVRNHPEEIGLLTDGEIISHHEENSDVKLENEKSWMIHEAMKIRSFWLMIFCMAVPSLINTGLTFHMGSIIQTKGFSYTFAATILSITAIVQFTCTFLAGHFLDRLKVHYVKAINFWMLIATMLILLLGQSKQVLILYGIFHGIFVAFDSVSTGVLWPNYFGRKYLGSIRSFTMTAMVIGASLGPLPFGLAYDFFQGYQEIILAMMLLPVLGSIAALLSPPPHEKPLN